MIMEKQGINIMQNKEITPYRLQVLLDMAAKAMKIMTNEAWGLTFEDMELVLWLIRQGIDESRKKNEKEETSCS